MFTVTMGATLPQSRCSVMLRAMHIRACLFALLVSLPVLLSACGGNASLYGSGSMTNNGVVTDDPNRIPDIAWQTNGQRQGLVRESDAFAQAPALPDPSRPGLQTIVGAAAPARTTKVAILLPLSGKSANLGQSMLKAAQMAMFDVGSAKFELVPIDTKSTPDGAAAGARQAVAAQADLMLGPIFADDVKAAKPAAGNVPMIAFTTDWTLGGGNTYIMGFLPFLQVARVQQFAQSRGLTKLAVFAPTTQYCDIVIDTLHRTGRPVAEGRYAPQQSDLSGVAADFAARNKTETGFTFDSIMLPVGSEGLRSLTTLLSQNGIRPPAVKLLGTGLWDDMALTNDPALYGGWFAAPDPQSRRDFENRYQSNYGEAAPRLATLAYDATALAAVLARSNHGGEPYARSQLTNARGFAGIDGVFRFRNDGLAERGLAILEIQSGRLKVIDPAPTAFTTSGS
jgi:ABC-type branched-subunit amino acid transport system substrate-binding protein